MIVLWFMLTKCNNSNFYKWFKKWHISHNVPICMVILTVFFHNPAPSSALTMNLKKRIREKSAETVETAKQKNSWAEK